ncbi:ADP-ribose 1''-phosphate phosphatase [Talaromyces atroroseus]|uniref:ADP-ribose 1''-phosphate phosphatase n=1 Tax=Talaromyces atroroseus TaxID=1441469 RepID=A0A225AMF4_TALAT|nr:ADP-ribose 1''-phosphate phosphatase [Talaromyces atroroseus]OKL58438.1 ADP-ribose 1''-phosphate phosphatase [Talaromyces atroroseus]
MKIAEIEGDLFDAPDGAALIHACNCLGSWGGGIAKSFKNKYPAAFKTYNAHCKRFLKTRQPYTIVHSTTGKPRTINVPLGTALIIPPQKEDYACFPTPATISDDSHNSHDDQDGMEKKKKHWIICLFTSRAYGRYVSKPDIILENSVHAIRDMRQQLERLCDAENGDEWTGQLYSCRFNSGLFGVEWEDSKRVLERELQGMEGVEEVVVVRPEGEE